MQAKGLGTWVDLDLYFIRPIDFDDEYVFGWEHRTSINGAVLRLPANSDMVRELCEIPQVNWRPPFYGPRKTAIFYWRRLTEGDIRPENYRWGTFGPMLLDVSGEEVRCCETGTEALRLLPGHSSQLEIALRPAGIRQSRADEGNEDSPPLAVRIEPENRDVAAAWVLP